MARSLVLAFLIIAFAGCATAPSASTPAIPNYRIYDATYDAVWGALMRALIGRGIEVENSDKARGAIDFSEKGESPVKGVEKSLDEIAYRPVRFHAVWIAYSVSTSIEVSEEGPLKTAVTVTSDIRGWNNVTGWEKLKSRGTYEKKVLGWVAGELRR